METDDLTPAMQEMMAQLAQVRAELNELKGRAGALPQPGPIQPAKTPTITSTRRNTLKRLGMALLGGVATAGALGEATTVQAKIVANPQGTLANKVGMLVLPPGAAAPTGAPVGTFGLIASSETTSTNLSNIHYSGNTGVYGFGSQYGVYGEGIVGIIAYASISGVLATGGNYGVSGTGGIFGVQGNSPQIGVQGISDQVSGIFGNYTNTLKTTASVGVIGYAGPSIDLNGFGDNINTGVYGRAEGNITNYAGYFAGQVYIGGPLQKPGGSFKIDHPTDPENKYLYHSFVESPDMMNIYNGIATLDGLGQSTVTMPDWFEALNRDYRYQLTSIGKSMPDLFIAEEIKERKFKVAGGLAGQRVSWMVTGIRQDAWANANRIPVEEEKSEDAKGKYLHPEAFGKSEEFRSM